MKRFIPTLLVIFATVALTSCGGSPFKITGTVTGLGTQNIHIIYRDGGHVRDHIVAVMDSKFEFEGNSPEETVVEIYNNMRAPLAYMVAKNGEEIELEINATDIYDIKVKGDATSERLAKFLAENKNSLNATIAGLVKKSPEDILSAVLLNYFYDPSVKPDEAAELFDLIDYSAAPTNLNIGVKEMIKRHNTLNIAKPIRLLCSADSMTTFYPLKDGYTLYCFDAEKHLNDSIDERFSDIPETNTRIGYFRMTTDTIGWSRSSRQLPKRVISMWAPGGVAEPGLFNLNITSLPFYIVTVDGGKQVYRGPDFNRAKAAMKKAATSTPVRKPDVNSDTIRATRSTRQ
ncbi:MAG: DUF4369 domain-containing protein [Muribaculaceae bacterium]|nr:DUF4369 domain-containing protein [Muribaculaceae bacterium]